MQQNNVNNTDERTRLVQVINQANVIEELAQPRANQLLTASNLTYLARQMLEGGFVTGNGYVFYSSLRRIVEQGLHCVREPLVGNQTHIACPHPAILPASVVVGTNAWFVNSVLAYRSTNEFIERLFRPGFWIKAKSALGFILGLATISPVTVYGLSGQFQRGFKHLRPIEVFDIVMSIFSSLANAFVYGNSYFHLNRVLHKLRKNFVKANWPLKMAILTYAVLAILATAGYGYNNYRYFQPTAFGEEYTPGIYQRLEKFGIFLLAGAIALLRFPLLLDSGEQLLEFFKKELKAAKLAWQGGNRAWAVARFVPSLGYVGLSSFSTLSIANITQQSVVASHPCPTNRGLEVQQRCVDGVKAWSWIESMSVAFIATVINFISLPGSFSSPQRILMSLTLLLSIVLFVGLDSLLLDRFRPIERNEQPAAPRTSSRLSFWHRETTANQALERTSTDDLRPSLTLS